MRAMRINRKKKECANAPIGPFTMFSHCVYGYNIRNELVSATKNSEYTEYQYQYDDIGNREGSSERGTNFVYTANQLNQYTVVDDFTPQFDDDGNQTLVRTTSGIWSVVYNGENRPVLWECVSTNSPTPNSSTPTLISMSYDRMGRRVTKNNQRFVYDGYLQIANSELATLNSKLQTFIWDPTEKVATRPIEWYNGYDTLFYTHDSNKNVSEVISENYNIVARYEYAPFGAMANSIGVFFALNPWRFSSEYADDSTAMVYYNYRYYNYFYGIWTVRDIIGYNSHEFSGDVVNNHYVVCDNNMLLFVDHLGQRKKGRYWAKKQRRLENLCKKIEGKNFEKQSFIKNLWNFINNFIDQRPIDPRAAFISEGLDICWAMRTSGDCPACCVMLGRYACDAGDIVPVVVSANVQCESCENAAKNGWLHSAGTFIKVAPMRVSNCK